MNDKPGRKEVEEAMLFVEEKKHGEVVIKIRNGVIYRVLTTQDKLVDKK